MHLDVTMSHLCGDFLARVLEEDVASPEERIQFLLKEGKMT